MGIERSVSTWNYQAVAICPDQLKVAAASDSRRREEQVAIGDRTRQTFFATDNSGGPGGQAFFLQPVSCCSRWSFNTKPGGEWNKAICFGKRH